MPFTAAQRRLFHAKTEQGVKGMSSLASEADSLAKAGKERPPVKDEHEMPEHVAKMSDGGMACKSCGGHVYAHGGSIAPHPEPMMGKEEESMAQPEQMASTHDMRAKAFADAVAYARKARG